jgi:hypothetical protein
MARTARSVRSYSASDAIIARAMFAGKAVREYTIDSKGRKVRKFSADMPCSRDDVRELLVNVRMITETEGLEVVGRNTLDYMVKVGYLVRDEASLYVTKAAAEKYALPAYMGAKTFRA